MVNNEYYIVTQPESNNECADIITSGITQIIDTINGYTAYTVCPITDTTIYITEIVNLPQQTIYVEQPACALQTYTPPKVIRRTKYVKPAPKYVIKNPTEEMMNVLNIICGGWRDAPKTIGCKACVNDYILNNTGCTASQLTLQSTRCYGGMSYNGYPAPELPMRPSAIKDCCGTVINHNSPIPYSDKKPWMTNEEIYELMYPNFRR